MKMKKLIVSLGVIASLIIGSGNPAMAASSKVYRPIQVNVNGDYVQTDANPEQVNNRILVPIRTLSSLGLTYNWNSSNKTVSISNKENSQVKVTLNSKKAYKDSNVLTLDVPAQMKNGRVYVPVRFVTQAFGSKVQFETIRQILFVTSEDKVRSSKDSNDLKSERQAAITLPIQSSFKLLSSRDTGFETESYSFPSGESDEYLFSDGDLATLVKIQNNKATAVGQFKYGAKADFAAVAGNIKGNTDPALTPFNTKPTTFQTLQGGIVTALYTNAKEQRVEIKGNKLKSYSDMILTIPDQK